MELNLNNIELSRLFINVFFFFLNLQIIYSFLSSDSNGLIKTHNMSKLVLSDGSEFEVLIIQLIQCIFE